MTVNIIEVKNIISFSLGMHVLALINDNLSSTERKPLLNKVLILPHLWFNYYAKSIPKSLLFSPPILDLSVNRDV